VTGSSRPGGPSILGCPSPAGLVPRGDVTTSGNTRSQSGRF
jgi:hypothetical protein